MTEEELQLYMKLIENYAWVALKKLRKPTIYSHEDLINEGVTLLLEAKERYQEDRKASFKTYFILLLRNHFCDIVKTSYAPHKCFLTDIQLENHIKDHYKKHKIKDPYNLAKTNLLLQTFTPAEKEYATQIMLSHQSSASKRREEVKETLHLTLEQENVIKKSIFIKLQN